MKKLLIILLVLVASIQMFGQNEYKYEVRAGGGIRVGPLDTYISYALVDSIKIVTGTLTFYVGGVPYSGAGGTGDLLADGSVPLTANWDVGAHTITALRFISDQTIGISPFVVSSTTVVSNLNSDLLDGYEGTYYLDNATHSGEVTGSGVLSIAANAVDDTHIDWGVGTNQVSAVDIPIADAGAIITATEVEAALQENRTAINLNTSKVITDLNATNWQLFYSNGTGNVTELALGTSGTYLESSGAGSLPQWSSPSGSGDVTKVGTPVDNQVGVWTGDGTLEGDVDLTFDGNNLSVNGVVTGTGFTIGSAAINEAELEILDGAQVVCKLS